ncbi:UNVERIFIED_CONTAM: hypothetical protein PYX00_011946 [Menopon gallinae]|uniref:Elongation factor Ts, mitochondrial n=1 Tax=Menopon gallinae TaxID=328185 RepID=A0AAW2H8U9_9NEOP
MSYNPSPAEVKKLREHTGAGMGDCKKALLAVEGDFNEAVIWLRKHNLAVAGKRCDRAAHEGRVFICVAGKNASVLELSCETDFVAMTEDMARLGESLAEELALSGSHQLNEMQEERLKEVAATLKENIGVRRIQTLNVGELELVGEYLHSKKNLGVLVKAKCTSITADNEVQLKELLKDLAMHIAAYAPIYISRDKVDESFLEEQRKIAEGQAQDLKGKPEQVIAKILKATPLIQVANVNIPEARMVVIQAWDKTVLPEIEKAIRASDLGVNPVNDGNLIRLNFPLLSEQRRKDTLKQAKGLVINLAINYGGQDEIIRAFERFCASKVQEPLNCVTLAKYLDVAELPNVDLVIRTSGLASMEMNKLLKAAHGLCVPKYLAFFIGVYPVVVNYFLALLGLGASLEGSQSYESLAPHSLLTASAWRRIVIYLAGPLFNILFAIIVFALVNFRGFSLPDYSTKLLVEGTQLTPLEKADVVLKVNGQEVQYYSDILKLLPNEEQVVEFAVERAGVLKDLRVFCSLLSFMKNVHPWIPLKISQVQANSPAKLAGLKTGDTILSVNGHKVEDYGELENLKENLSRGEYDILVERHGSQEHLKLYTVMPKWGILFSAPLLRTQKAKGLVQALEQSYLQTFQFMLKAFEGIWALILSPFTHSKYISGPVGITGQLASASSQGLTVWLQLLGLISASLAAMNLFFPISVLDGGQAFIALLEALRRKRFTTKTLMRVHMSGLLVVLILLVLGVFNDMGTLFK